MAAVGQRHGPTRAARAGSRGPARLLRARAQLRGQRGPKGMPTTGTGGPTGRRATTALRAAGAGVYGAGAGPLLRRRIPVCGVLQWHLPLLRYTSRYLAAEVGTRNATLERKTEMSSF